ncbi:MAG TPA: hypothetical protein VNZ45_16255 [Bacteroidia bacterium]|nr:hypothetical protein [Bacteroidia bacterium]
MAKKSIIIGFPLLENEEVLITAPSVVTILTDGTLDTTRSCAEENEKLKMKNEK